MAAWGGKLTRLRRAGAASPSAAAAEALGLATIGTGLAIGFGPVRRTSAVAALLIAALPVPVARFGTVRRVTVAPLRMALLAIVAAFSALPLVPAIGLGEPTLTSLRLSLLRGL